MQLQRYNWESLLPSSFFDYCRFMATHSHTSEAGGSRQEEVSLLCDIGHFAFRLKEEEGEERVRRTTLPNHELERRIEEYNRSNRTARDRDKQPQNRNKNSGEERQRKVRTTITPDKLEEMNRIFSDYFEKEKAVGEHREWVGSAHSMVNDHTSLKDIGERLQLGYSTILHKYREYKATQRVKGGALIKAMHNKRKYKKSKEIEQMIRQSLCSQQKFYTAVELSQYIEKRYDRRLSRSIISRHLGQMGYSYKNVKTRLVDCNTKAIKELRECFAAAVVGLRDEESFRVCYVDEVEVGELGVMLCVEESKVVMWEVGSWGIEQYYSFMGRAASQVGPKGLLILPLNDRSRQLDRVSSLRTQLETSHHSKLFFTPPESRSLHMVEHLAAEMREGLRELEGELGGEEVQQWVEEWMGRVDGEKLERWKRECERYLQKAAREENF